MSRMSDADVQVREAIKKIRDIRAEYSKWTEENEDLCGVDDETWYDTIAHFDERLGSAGIALADLLEQLMGVNT